MIVVAGGGLRAQGVDARTATDSVRYYRGEGREPLMWQLFYHDGMDGSKVRLRDLKFDSLPDEVNIKLIKDSTEFCFPM